MANQWPAPNYDDGSCNTTAAAIGIPVFQSPIPAVSDKDVFTQVWQGPVDFAAVAYGTAHPSAGMTPDYSAYKLVNEGSRQDIGGGQVRWTRTYAKVPASYDEYESFAYPFIGYYGTYGGILATGASEPTGRNRQTIAVESRVKHDFFLEGTTVTDPITGGSVTITTAGNIPIIQQQKYRILVSGTTWWMDTDWLSDNPPFTFATTPSRSRYETYCRNVATALSGGTNPWATDVVSWTWTPGTPSTATENTTTTPGQICAEDSRLDRWLGPIWLRRTRFVLAI